MMRPSSLAVFALKFLQKSMMLTPCGPSAVPTGGAGVAFPAAICNLTTACTFLAMILDVNHEATKSRRKSFFLLLRVFVSSWLDFLHLQEVQFHGRRPSEDRHHHLQGVLVEVHLVDDAIEAGERPFVDPDLLALLEHVLRLRFLRRRAHLLQDLLD